MGSREAFAPWAAHLSVVDGPGKNPGITKASVVPMFPSPKSRLRALALLGAHMSQPPRRMSGRIWLFLGPLLAIFILAMGAILYLLVIVSVALSGMFTWIPLVILHVLLRAI